MNKYVCKSMLFVLLIVNMFPGRLAIAETEGCRRDNNVEFFGILFNTSDTCWCSSEQLIGKCLTHLNKLREPFPTFWNIAEPGPFYGFSADIDIPNNTVYLYYYGSLAGIYPVVISSADKWLHNNAIFGDLLTGGVSFNIETVNIVFVYGAMQVSPKTKLYSWVKQFCIDGTCYTSN